VPYEYAPLPIETAVRAVLVAYAPLTSAINVKPSARGGGPAIYADGNVPAGALMPYLTIGAWTQNGDHRLTPDSAGWGWNCTGQIKAVGQRGLNQTSGEPEDGIKLVISRVVAALPEGMQIDVDGYGRGTVGETVIHPTIKTVIGNVVTYEIPAIVRVRAYD
jgi:hypothetical protein